MNDAEGDMKEFAHDGVTDSEGMEFTTFEYSDPRLEGFAPAPSDRWPKESPCTGAGWKVSYRSAAPLPDDHCQWYPLPAEVNCR